MFGCGFHRFRQEEGQLVILFTTTYLLCWPYSPYSVVAGVTPRIEHRNDLVQMELNPQTTYACMIRPLSTAVVKSIE
jgi:hypothetical protein